MLRNSLSETFESLFSDTSLLNIEMQLDDEMETQDSPPNSSVTVEKVHSVSTAVKTAEDNTNLNIAFALLPLELNFMILNHLKPNDLEVLAQSSKTTLYLTKAFWDFRLSNASFRQNIFNDFRRLLKEINEHNHQGLEKVKSFFFTSSAQKDFAFYSDLARQIIISQYNFPEIITIIANKIKKQISSIDQRFINCLLLQLGFKKLCHPDSAKIIIASIMDSNCLSKDIIILNSLTHLHHTHQPDCNVLFEIFRQLGMTDQHFDYLAMKYFMNAPDKFFLIGKADPAVRTRVAYNILQVMVQNENNIREGKYLENLETEMASFYESTQDEYRRYESNYLRYSP
ncbi:F-box protein [Aquicella lusitana]|uniref:F-box domain-containing protein n=1 Tax=Aquicella lusitana TaxID=254246 RepID=A0A370GI25_9COXI|nr:hypothetical protein [Aquicella lusitana]RDI42866.1 hypothetical protein C8D86_11264 [Aquicella lusitana]VVC73109.1 hypothetical protein AQULUS_08400 [Aquicella lusitana]